MIDNQNAVKISNILALFCEILCIECLGWMARSSRARSVNRIHRQKEDVLAGCFRGHMKRELWWRYDFQKHSWYFGHTDMTLLKHLLPGGGSSAAMAAKARGVVAHGGTNSS